MLEREFYRKLAVDVLVDVLADLIADRGARSPPSPDRSRAAFDAAADLRAALVAHVRQLNQSRAADRLHEECMRDLGNYGQG